MRNPGRGGIGVTLPDRLHELLARNAELAAQTTLAAHDLVEAWVGDDSRGLALFPDFTDHGPRHINRILQTVDELIPDAAFPHLTPSDASVILLASLLHDSAMHLTEEQFVLLIRDGARDPIDGFADATWTEAWHAYFTEARHWNDRQLEQVFGAVAKESDPFLQVIRQPEEMGNPETWTKSYRRFLGEFVRRHHARLAHELARIGLPSPGGTLRLSVVPDDIADIAGVVARSHNFAVRTMFPYMKRRYFSRVHAASTHPVYLMVLLRIADYLDIHADRAPGKRLRVRTLASPVSRREWAAHAAIKDVRVDDEDAEALFVVAAPPSLELFIRLRELLDGLQQELDTSWAVLGEVFSRQGDGLDSFGLTIRRVRSNLDPELLREAELPFEPREARFTTADAEILRLLVGPLYGDRPEVGVRELLQNAVDAVRERHALAGRGASAGSDVTISVVKRSASTSMEPNPPSENWEYYVQCTDSGIGMKPDVVIDYFLKAGASARKSIAWIQTFGRRGDDPSRPAVLRSGRFGIGTLAAFLLGDEIDVITRSLHERRAVRFRARLANELVELRYVDGPVGTTIRVRIDAGTYRALADRPDAWDWYSLRDPGVMRTVGNIALPQQLTLPQPGAELAFPAGRTASPGYTDVQWSYSDDWPPLICNGIRVSSETGLRADPDSDPVPPYFQLKFPAVSVFDPGGSLPLTLRRDGVTHTPVRLVEDIWKTTARLLIAWTLQEAPENVPNANWRAYFEHWLPPFLDMTQDGERVSPFLWTHRGIGLLTPWHISRAGHRLLFEYDWDHWNPGVRLDAIDAYGVARSQVILAGFTTTVSVRERVSRMVGQVLFDALRGAELRAVRLYLQDVFPQDEHRFFDGRFLQLLQRPDVWHIDHGRYAAEWCIGNCEYSAVDPTSLLRWGGSAGREPTSALIEAYIGPTPGPDSIGEIWQEVIGQPFIPHRREDRKHALGRAYDVLRPELATLEHLRANVR